MAPKPEITCRSYKSEADCQQEERAKQQSDARSRPSVSSENVSEVPTPAGVVRVERIEVLPDPEELPLPPGPGRWEKFERSLGPGRSARRTVRDFVGDDGRRWACYEPCPAGVNCCQAATANPSLATPPRWGPGGY